MFTSLLKKIFKGSSLDARALEYAVVLRPMLGKTWCLEAGREKPCEAEDLKLTLHILSAAKGQLGTHSSFEFDKYVCFAIQNVVREMTRGEDYEYRTHDACMSLMHWISNQLGGRPTLEYALVLPRPEAWWIGLRQYWVSQMIDEVKDKLKELQC
jgi:hypothetical protein